MKKIYLLSVFFLFCLGSKAQLVLTNSANAPVVGDTRNDAQYDSTTAVPKATGTGLTWNFTSLAVGNFTEMITYTTVASTPLGTMFPAANLAIVRGGSNYDYFSSQTSSLSMVGMAKPSNSTSTAFSNPGTWISWPLTSGNGSSDSFLGTEVTPTATNNWSGTMTHSATGTGTVVLPNGNTHNNCLQVIRTISLNVTGSQTSTQTIKHYEYYSSTSKFPIITIEYQTEQTSSGSSKNFRAAVNVSALTTGITQQVLNNDLGVYPNPVKDVLNLQLGDNVTPEKIEMFDAAGRLVLSEKNSRTVNVTSLPAGTYMLKASSGNSVLEKQVIVTK